MSVFDNDVNAVKVLFSHFAVRSWIVSSSISSCADSSCIEIDVSSYIFIDCTFGMHSHRGRFVLSANICSVFEMVVRFSIILVFVFFIPCDTFVRIRFFLYLEFPLAVATVTTNCMHPVWNNQLLIELLAFELVIVNSNWHAISFKLDIKYALRLFDIAINHVWQIYRCSHRSTSGTIVLVNVVRLH